MGKWHLFNEYTFANLYVPSTWGPHIYYIFIWSNVVGCELLVELYWRSLMNLLYWEWHLIPNWPLREHLRLASRAASQRLSILRKSWRVFHDRSVLERCFRSFVLPVLEYCSAVWCSDADIHFKLLDSVVSGARFLTGGVFECDISHRRSVAFLCIRYKMRCNPMHPINDALPWTVCASAGYTRCPGRTSVH